MQTRTRRQKQVLDFILRYIDNNGCQPSYQSIARHLGVRSKAGIAKHVEALELQGLLQRRRENGSFKLELARNNRTPSNGHEIEWLETASDNDELDEWQTAPFALPEFLLGDLSPSSLAAFRVTDNAMSEKFICEGDIALIEKRSHARDGACVVASIKNRETLLRSYYREGSKIVLVPTNENFEEIKVSGELIEIHGIFRGLLRRA